MVSVASTAEIMNLIQAVDKRMKNNVVGSSFSVA